MIEKTIAFKVGEQFFPCIENAQAHELSMILAMILGDTDWADKRPSCMDVSKIILAHKDEVLNVLTMTPKSHARARKANGATRKPRTPRATAANAELTGIK